MVLPLKSPLPYTAYLLAGGQSRRFGTDKARALWQGQAFVVYQWYLLSRCFQRVEIIARTAQAYVDLGLPKALVDRYADCGPLGGLHRALEHQGGQPAALDWVFLASCDTFGVTQGQISALAQAIEHNPLARAAVWTFEQRPEPLWGFYHRDLYADVEAALQQQNYALQALLKRHPVHFLTLQSPWIQLNRPEDLRKALQNG